MSTVLLVIVAYGMQFHREQNFYVSLVKSVSL